MLKDDLAMTELISKHNLYSINMDFILKKKLTIKKRFLKNDNLYKKLSFNLNKFLLPSVPLLWTIHPCLLMLMCLRLVGYGGKVSQYNNPAVQYILARKCTQTDLHQAKVGLPNLLEKHTKNITVGRGYLGVKQQKY